MALWANLKRRRIFPFLGAYIAAGFLALEGVDQLVSHAILPELGYKIALVFYLFGIPGTTVLAWFHGEKGYQKPRPLELWLQAGLLVLCLAVCYRIVEDYRTAAATSVDAATAAGLDPKRIAVLYFEDLSSDGELTYLADGLTEALIDRLYQVRALDVVSRNGVSPFRGSDLPRDSVARALEAGSLIEGSVERRGERIRVTARLVDGLSGVDIQRESFEQSAGDLLVIRDTLSNEVASFLRERLGEEVRLRERRASTRSGDAWALVQRAERLRKDAEAMAAEDDYDEALLTFERADSVLALAEALDPAWPDPPVLRGWIAYRLGRIDLESWEEWAKVALGHAGRALEMAPNQAEALELKGTVEYATWLFERPSDPDEAGRLLEQAKADLEAATQIDPTLASAYSTLSHLYYQVEDVPSVVLSARRAYEEDAYLDFADAILWRLFNASLDLEQFQQAERWCLEGAKRFPDNYRFSSCQLLLMVTPAQPPNVERAWELAARVDSLTPAQWQEYESVDALMMVGGVLARAELADSARKVLAAAHGRVTNEIDPEQSLLGHEAYMLTLLGDYDGAVDLWKRYAAANPGHFDGSDDVSWWWRELQDHPEFQRLVGGGER
jgi:serine/threonine-protein kinase